MGDRTDLPKIKPTEAPSMFNQSAGVGSFWGSLIGGIPAYFAKTAGRTKLAAGLSVGGMVIGGLWGGASGKAQQEREMTEGRVVKEPGYWNKGIITGMMVGGLLGFIPIVGPVAGLVGSLGGMVVGSVMRKNDLQLDFNRAVALRDQQQAQMKGNQPSYMNSVSPAEAAELASKQKSTVSQTDKLATQQASANIAAAR